MQQLNRLVVRRVCRLIAMVVLCTGFSVNQPRDVHNAGRPAVIGPVAEKIYFPEVRLRKLHLVRPDLIQYPIFYEIFC